MLLGSLLKRKALTGLLTACMMLGGMGVSLKNGPQNPYYTVKKFTLYDVDQSEMASYNCLPSHEGTLGTAAPMLRWDGLVSPTSLWASCTSSGTLVDWDDALGSSAGTSGETIRQQQFLKAPGVSWTVRRLSCYFFGVEPADADDGENIDFRVGWVDKDSTPVLTADPTIEIDSASAINTHKSVALDFDVGTRDSIAGLVVLVKSDANGEGSAFTSLNVGCSVLVEII